MVKKGKKSFGILCIESKSPYRVVVCSSPSYAAMNVIMNNKRKDCANDSVTVSLNSYESQNVLLSSFPYGCIGEGQYTFPRGQISKIDKNDKSRTKIREFIEEAKHSCRELEMYDNCHRRSQQQQHRTTHNQYSWLTNDDYCVREKWIGLDFKLYTAEYSILVVEKNFNESLLKIFLRNDNTIPINYIFKRLTCFNGCTSRDKKRYINQYIKRDRHIDRFKRYEYIPLKEALNLIKMNRIKTIEALDEKKILEAIKK